MHEIQKERKAPLISLVPKCAKWKQVKDHIQWHKNHSNRTSISFHCWDEVSVLLKQVIDGVVKVVEIIIYYKKYYKEL
jgi:hypothetical protein